MFLLTEKPVYSREGKKPFSADAPIREGMRGNTKCSSCVYAADNCKDIDKYTVKSHDMIIVLKCSGYQKVH